MPTIQDIKTIERLKDRYFKFILNYTSKQALKPLAA